ncbi:MAG: restriction endonuclease subunit S [Eggerthellaceae bacterium]|nr:restriction endonuclease subunit S [Eggerthellaceae bacterium]
MKAKDLKNAILQMAVQGALVPQDPSDEPASALLERIREERAELIGEKKIKAPKGGESVIYRAEDGSYYEKRIDARGRESEPVCIDDEIPFDIPETWEWVRLEAIEIISTGKKDANYGRDGGTFDFFTCSSTPIKCPDYSFDGDCLILPGNGANVGMVTHYVGKFEAYQRTYVAQALIENCYQDWVYLCMLHGWNRYNKDKMYGSATPYIKLGNLTGYLVPIPPLAEQHCIVDRAAKLMPLVEEYGKLEDTREKLDAELPDKLRKSVLQMAVQGALVPQDPSDEPASALLERIREERAELIRKKKMKAPKGGESVIYRAEDGSYYEKRIDAKGKVISDTCIDDEIPFEIPETWEWTRLESLIVLLSGVDLNSTEYNDKREGIPYLTGASNFDQGQLVENRWTEHPKRESSKGDLLFTCKGTVGEMAINCFERAHIARQIMAIRPTGDIHLPYLQVYLGSLVSSIKTSAKGVIPGIERTTLLEALVPIPPLAEQHRIVERVAELMPLIEGFGKLDSNQN